MSEKLGDHMKARTAITFSELICDEALAYYIESKSITQSYTQT